MLVGLAGYTNAVIGVGACLLLLVLPGRLTGDLLTVAGLAGLAVATALLKMDLRLSAGNATMTLGYAVGFLGLLTVGPDATAIVLAVGIWTQSTYNSQFSAGLDLRRRLFSVACGVITVEAAGWAFQAVGGSFGAPMSVEQAAPLAAAAQAYFFVNTGLVAGAIALSTHQRIFSVWHKNFLLSWPSYFVSALVVGLGLFIIDRSGYLVALLAALPLVLTFFAYRAYLGRLADEQNELRIAQDGKGIDALTGLPNRWRLMTRIERAIEHHRANPGRQFALLFVDLDGFKQINDSLGHRVGDRLLQALAKRLEESLRQEDFVVRTSNADRRVEHTVARLGGDEFVVLLHDVPSVDDARDIADRVQAVLERSFDLDGRHVAVTASVGISLGSADCASAEDVLRDADTAMYRAKTLGKARTEVFDASIHGLILGRKQLDHELRLAVERHEFLPYYQPIINLRTGRLAGFETLLRWQHPEHGLLAPAEFMSVMEENGMVGGVGRQVFHDVCRQVALWQTRWPEASRLAINFNLSGQQFLDVRLVDDFAGILAEVGLDPSSIVIEITEASALRQLGRAATVLQRARRLGLRIVLDNFGTGYASLSCLHELPISGIKLDRSFLAQERRHPAVLQAIVALADRLNLSITAEGVETAEQCDELRRLGCGLAQGYLFSRPVPAEAVESLLARTGSWVPRADRSTRRDRDVSAGARVRRRRDDRQPLRMVSGDDR